MEKWTSANGADVTPARSPVVGCLLFYLRYPFRRCFFPAFRAA
jgi:hypothetical protein